MNTHHHLEREQSLFQSTAFQVHLSPSWYGTMETRVLTVRSPSISLQAMSTMCSTSPLMVGFLSVGSWTERCSASTPCKSKSEIFQQIQVNNVLVKTMSISPLQTLMTMSQFLMQTLTFLAHLKVMSFLVTMLGKSTAVMATLELMQL